MSAARNQHRSSASQCADHLIRLSSLCDTGSAADRRDSTVVLGSRARQNTGLGIWHRESGLVPQDHRTRLNYPRMYDEERRRDTVC